jgi:hypothetical protein
MRLILSIFLLLCFVNPGFCADSKSKKHKKKNAEIQKMVETKEEWEQEAKNVPLSERKLKQQEEPKTDKKYYFPKAHYVFERYNYPPGSREYDIRFIKKNMVEHPIITADLNCHYVAYANYYYRADIDQIYSDFYVEKLDSSKTKTQRILDYNHKQEKRTPVVTAGFREQYKNLFNGLSLVDWSADSNKVLIKEKIGSTINGIYKVVLYVYFVDSDKTLKLSNFNQDIIDYYTNYEDIQLIKYRYELVPLGFSVNNDDMIVAHCYTYDADGKKIFMGLWGYDLSENKTVLLSKTNPIISISSNGLVLKRVLE